MLDQDYFFAFLTGIRSDLTRQQMTDIHRQVDVGGDGEVDLSDFVNGLELIMEALKERPFPAVSVDTRV